MTLYSIYDGSDQLGIIGKVAPGLFAPEGRCWRMVYEKSAAQATDCMEPATWSERWKFREGWAKVWSCDRHTVELSGAKRLSRPTP